MHMCVCMYVCLCVYYVCMFVCMLFVYVCVFVCSLLSVDVSSDRDHVLLPDISQRDKETVHETAELQSSPGERERGC